MSGQRPGIIALDVGDHRIGVAAGERGSSWVFGRGIITMKPIEALAGELREILERERADLIVLGLPVHLDGTDSIQTTSVREFANQLAAAGFQVDFQDERMTSKIAEQQIAKSTLSATKRREKGRVDEAAAVLILETYLARGGAK